jgi:TolA-binding protein/predicted Ser/Thr protein kinase
MSKSPSNLSPQAAAFIGRLAVERGLVTAEQLKACEQELARLGPAAPGGPPRHLGTLLVARGHLKDQDLVRLLETQRARVKASSHALRQADRRLGALLIKAGHATREQVAEALREQHHARESGAPDVPRIGEILVKKGFCAQEQVAAALKEHHKVIVVCSLCGTRYNLAFYNEQKVPPCKKCGEKLVRPESLTDVHVDGSVAAIAPVTEADVPEDVSAAMARAKSRFGKYVLVSELGRGGAGVVYKAWEPALRRYVAIKVLGARGAGVNETEVRRFHREAQTAARLKHPGIVSIYEVGQQDGQHFLALEYVDGRTLDAIVEAGIKRKASGSSVMTPERAAEVVRDAARAVAAAHEQGIIHRDLKPQNILMDAAGKPHVTDFGLAKSVESNRKEAANLTLGGIVVGTPAYMSPEQASGGKRPVDVRTDVYSLGGVLYYLLAGRAPFRGANAYEIVAKVLREEPPAPRTFRATVPEDLDTICMKCLDKDPALRYPSAEALAEELKRFLEGEPIEARPLPAPVRWLRRVRRRPMPWAGAAAAVIAGFALLAFWPRTADHTEKIASLLAAADRHARAERYAEARDAYTQVLALDPQNGAAAKGKQACLVKLQRREEQIAAEAGSAAQEAARARMAELERQLKALQEEKANLDFASKAQQLEKEREIAASLQRLQEEIDKESAAAGSGAADAAKDAAGTDAAGESAPPDASAGAKTAAANASRKPEADKPASAAPKPPDAVASAGAVPARPAAPAKPAVDLKTLLDANRYADLRKAAAPDDPALAAQVAAAADLWDVLVKSADTLKTKKVKLTFRSASLGAQDVKVLGLTADTVTVSGLFKSEGSVPQPLKDLAPESFVEMARACAADSDAAARERCGQFLLLHGQLDGALAEFAEARRLGAPVDEPLGRIIAAYRASIPADADAKELRRRAGIFQNVKLKFGRVLTEAQNAEVDAIAGALKERLSAQEAQELIKTAELAAGKKQYREAQSALDKVLKQYADTPSAPRAREMLKALPTPDGRLLLGFDEAGEASANCNSGEVTWSSDPKLFREGSGAAHIVLRPTGGVTLTGGGTYYGFYGTMARAWSKFSIPEQSFEKMKSVSFWAYSDPAIGKQGMTKVRLYSPALAGAENYFEANFFLEGRGWIFVRLHAGQFKTTGNPSNKRINAIGFVTMSNEARDFIIDSVRVKDD